MEVEKRLPAGVEDTGFLFDHPGPATHVGQHVDDVVEECERTVGHRSAQGARHF
jgi:hypothetical protein